jgi:hypothetical protein
MRAIASARAACSSAMLTPVNIVNEKKNKHDENRISLLKCTLNFTWLGWSGIHVVVVVGVLGNMYE